MDLSSSTRRERIHWPLATALALALAAAPAYAQVLDLATAPTSADSGGGDDDERFEKRRPHSFDLPNPCFLLPGEMFPDGKKRRCKDVNDGADCEIVHCPAPGKECTIKTTERISKKGDKYEHRVHTTTTNTTEEGEGLGNLSQVIYKMRRDTLVVMRKKNKYASELIRTRDMGDPKRPLVPLEASDECALDPATGTPTAGCAARWFHTVRTVTGKDPSWKADQDGKVEEETKCRDERGRERGADDD
jgi:hypothetical protein